MKDEKRSHCNGWPTQKKMMVSLWQVTYLYGRWKKYEVVSLLWVTYPSKNMENDLIVMGDLPRKMMVSLWWATYPNERWSHCDGWPTHMKGGGIIMMGDLPRKKMMEDDQNVNWSHSCGWPTQRKNMMVSLWWVTYPDEMMVSLWYVTYLEK